MIVFELDQTSDRVQIVIDSLMPLRSVLSSALNMKLNLVIEEVIENIFNNNAREDLFVNVCIQLINTDSRKVEISVQDNGEAFDLTEYSADAPCPEMLRGRGVYLIKHYAESLTYTRDDAMNLLNIIVGENA